MKNSLIEAHRKMNEALNEGEFTIEDIMLSANRNMTFIDGSNMGYRMKEGILCFSHEPNRVSPNNIVWFSLTLFFKKFTILKNKPAVKNTKEYPYLTISKIMRDKSIWAKTFISEGKYFKIIDGALCYGDSPETIDRWNIPIVTLKIFKQKFEEYKTV